jgi:hypothetical protein
MIAWHTCSALVLQAKFVRGSRHIAHLCKGATETCMILTLNSDWPKTERRYWWIEKDNSTEAATDLGRLTVPVFTGLAAVTSCPQVSPPSRDKQNLE